jgi:oxalate decarboxylase/phosphoglucose isomerase-like protein (cupin superfamily)
MYTPFAERTHEEMKDVLMYPEAIGPQVHYYMIRGGTDKTNVTIWENGTVGGEYIKAYGHYHAYPFIETYTIVSGEGILLLQTRKKDAQGKFIDDSIESISATFVAAGDTIKIPEDCGHLLVNIGSHWLVTIDDSPVNLTETNAVKAPSHADYEPMRRLRGFAYYVIEENGKPIFVKNPMYTEVPPITIFSRKETH